MIPAQIFPVKIHLNRVRREGRQAVAVICLITLGGILGMSRRGETRLNPWPQSTDGNLYCLILEKAESQA